MKNENITLDSLMFEITRRCNMKCEHCLRGEAQDMDISPEVIDRVLDKVDYIGQISFTGGEPSLKPDIMLYILEKCQEKKIEVGSFYLATNAKEVSTQFLFALLKWYAYCLECSDEASYACSLAPSADEFHEYVPDANWNLLKAFSFWSDNKVHSSNPNRKIICEGRAKNLSPYDYNLVLLDDESEISATLYSDGQIAFDSMIYVAANGDIKTSCDTAYDNDDYTVCNVLQDEWFSMLINNCDFR